MYRVAKKTTKKTQDYCLSCKYHKLIRTTINKLNIIECTAPNKCMIGEFAAKDFYCVEFKSFNKMTNSQQKNIIKKQQDKESLALFKQYARKYYEKQIKECRKIQYITIGQEVL